VAEASTFQSQQDLKAAVRQVLADMIAEKKAEAEANKEKAEVDYQGKLEDIVQKTIKAKSKELLADKLDDKVFGDKGNAKMAMKAVDAYLDQNKTLKKSLDDRMKGFGDKLQKDAKGFLSKNLNMSDKALNNMSGSFMAGVNAYKSGDPLSGAISGMQFGPIGAAIGFIGGMLGASKTQWNRHKFQDAEKAKEKPFWMGFKGEKELYDMPESFYFRTGAAQAIGSRTVVVNIGGDQFDNYIQDSVTNNYSSQLQRGLAY
jgi:hypothetical protein